MIVAPPPSSPAGPSHKRTPSEADRWLEEVSKSVKAPQHNAAPPPAQPFPPHGQPPASSVPSVAAAPFVPSLPASVPMLPPRQPAFQAPMANGLAFPPASVPVVGITPSQMVANVFGSVTQPPPFAAPASTTPQHDVAPASNISPFIKPPPPSAPPLASNGGVAFNGADGWAAHAQLAPSSPAVQPPPPPPQDDAFEAQWAALEGRSRQRTTPSPTNPFSSELHKTFEIQL